MSKAYEFWLSAVKQRLWNPDAIKCVAAPGVLEEWYKAGFTAQRVTVRLNERWITGYLERKMENGYSKSRVE